MMASLWAPVAQLDRALGYEPRGQRFESSPVHPLKIMIIFDVFAAGPIETNTVLIGCPKTHHALLIDCPSECATWVEKRVKALGLHLDLILLTHSHWDHIADAAKLKKIFKVPIWVHAEDASNVEKPGSDGLPLYFPIEGVKPDGALVDGQAIKVGDISIKVIHTPGHTPGSVCFYFPDQGILVSGDTLFRGTMGRLDLPTGRPALMKGSLNKLGNLPPQTRVYPGHGEPTTIKEEAWIKKY